MSKWDLVYGNENVLAMSMVHEGFMKSRKYIRKCLLRGEIHIKRRRKVYTQFFEERATDKQIIAFCRQAKLTFEFIEETEQNGQFIFSRLFGICCIAFLCKFNWREMRVLRRELQSLC